MYAPQYPIQPRSIDTATPHIHAPETTLKEHEDEQQFKTYLAGRHLAYSKVISDAHESLARVRRIQESNPHDSALRALTEGQIEGLKEILHLVENAKELA